MPGAPHRVRRQLWRVRAATAPDAFALRGELRAAWESVLLPALEAAFDEAAGAGGERVIRIPRLELRVRLERPGDLVSELPRLVREAAAVELARARRGGASAAWEAGAAAGVHDVAPADDRRATLLHYLRTGALPWEAAGGAAGEATAALRAAARAEGARLVDRLTAEPRPHAFAFRLLQLLDEGDAVAWIAALSARMPPLWRRVLLRLLAPSAASNASSEKAGGTEGDAIAAGAPAGPWAAPPRHARLDLAAALVAEALGRTVGDDAEALTAAAGRTRDGGSGDARASILSAIPELASAREGERGRPKARGTTPRSTDHAVGEDGGGKAGSPGGSMDATHRGSPPAAGTGRDANVGTARLAAERAPRAGATAAGDELALSVCSAGLIILHTFIPLLLEARGVRDGDTLPPHALPRAAALLHYLATGRDAVLEWELGLVKVLLGLEADQPLLVADGLLDADDREECEHLLRSVIGHWSVLRESSPALVRETFLRRGGLLSRDAYGWTLRVEPAPFDVLLAHLPWSISVARLPWMPHPIHTEWKTTP